MISKLSLKNNKLLFAEADRRKVCTFHLQYISDLPLSVTVSKDTVSKDNILQDLLRDGGQGGEIQRLEDHIAGPGWQPPAF